MSLVVFNRLEDSNCRQVVGPNWIVGGGTSFPSGYFGNGISAASTGQGAYAFVESVLPNNNAGTLEYWWNKPASPTGLFGMLGDMGLTKGFEVQFRISGPDYSELQLTCFKRTVPPNYLKYYVAHSTISNGWHHLAMCWDRNGISGSANTVRAYIDGSQVDSTNNAIAAETFPSNYPICAGAGYQSGLVAPGVGSITDNIKLYDYAKTDFNDRFDERGGIQDLLIIT